MPTSQTTVIEAVERKKKQAGSTLPIRTPAFPLGPVDMDGDEVQGGVESDEALSSVRCSRVFSERRTWLTFPTGGRGRVFKRG
jgi:hypothetical protein